MEKLEKKFTGRGEVRGITFTQVKETENGYIYKRSDELFEVFEKRTQKEGTKKYGRVEIHFKEKELYPTSNAFGKWAWCCSTLDNAEIRICCMQKHERSINSNTNILL
jgi:hypothetical protein